MQHISPLLLVLTCWALLSILVRPEELPSEDYRSGYETLVVKVAMQLWGLIIVYLVLSFFYGFPKLGPKFRIHRYQYFIIVSIMIVLLPFARHNLFFQSIPLYKPGFFGFIYFWLSFNLLKLRCWVLFSIYIYIYIYTTQKKKTVIIYNKERKVSNKAASTIENDYVIAKIKVGLNFLCFLLPRRSILNCFCGGVSGMYFCFNRNICPSSISWGIFQSAILNIVIMSPALSN